MLSLRSYAFWTWCVQLTWAYVAYNFVVKDFKTVREASCTCATWRQRHIMAQYVTSLNYLNAKGVYDFFYALSKQLFCIASATSLLQCVISHCSELPSSHRLELLSSYCLVTVQPLFNFRPATVQLPSSYHSVITLPPSRTTLPPSSHRSTTIQPPSSHRPAIIWLPSSLRLTSV